MLLNEEKIIFDEIQYLFNNQKNYKCIDTIYYPSFNEKSRSIGENVKLSFSNYTESFYNTSKEKKLQIVFCDSSMAFLNYCFQEDGYINEHHLSYYPAPTDEKTEADTLSRMLRFDYEKEGFKARTHSLTHLHNGRYSYYRFAVENIVYPLEFISYIMMTNYNEVYNELIDNFNESRKTITNEEKGVFSLHILKAE